ncbi:hypothetical protein [Nocardia lijiangensis]|uniref:hypothetical protein n=1 Tax=Nocardia lijiangensis TaxID=299618 RepID=UPI003D712651
MNPAPTDDSGSTEIAVTAAATGTGTLSVKVAVRNYMAVQHMWSALRSARMCEEREAELVAAGERNVDLGHRADAISAVLSAVAFLEAFVNETFSDAAESEGGTFRTAGLSPAVVTQMGQFWTGGAVPIERGLPVIRKYQLALLCAGQPLLDTGSGPAQAVNVLIDLRNALVHFMPQTQDIETAHKLENGLRPRITPNKQAIGAPWYPNSALAAGCARWACTAAMELADEWQQRMGLVYDYRKELNGMKQP